MSDGASEGYRWARESEARQKKVDAFFEVLIACAQASEVDRKAFDGTFDAFDAIRYAGHVARGRLEKDRDRRRTRLREHLHEAIGESRAGQRPAWAEILTLALQHASPSVLERLQAEAKPFAGVPIALYVPNGRGREPTLCGDLESVLDQAAKGRSLYVKRIFDAERAVVGIIIGGGESTEPERETLRFMAVRKE